MDTQSVRAPRSATRAENTYPEKTFDPRKRRLKSCIYVLMIVPFIWALWPRLPTWQIHRSTVRGLSFVREPHLDLDISVKVKNANYVPLQLYDRAEFEVHWHDSDRLGFGHIAAAPFLRPVSTLSIELRVPTRASVLGHLAAQGRFLRLNVSSVVSIRALFFLHIRVAVHCKHIVKHSFPRIPQITEAECAYTLLGHQNDGRGSAWLRYLSTLRHHWTLSPRY